MTSFQSNLAAGLKARGIQVCFQLNETPIDAILLTSTSRNLIGLLQHRRRGIPIVQRLDGINWLHRRLRTGVRHFLRAEYGNRLLALLRSKIATRIVYQSEFVQGWWTRQFGEQRLEQVMFAGACTLPLADGCFRAAVAGTVIGHVAHQVVCNRSINLCGGIEQPTAYSFGL